MARIFRPQGTASTYRPRWISFTGPDARDFLQRLTTVDTRVLEPGQGAEGFFLNPQGKIRSFFTLWNYQPDEYAFEIDAGPDGKWQDELLAVIDQFHFSEKFTLTPTEGILEAAWIFGDARQEAGTTQALESGVRLCQHWEPDFGMPWTTVWARPDQLDTWLKAEYPDAKLVAEPKLEAWRIESMTPRPGKEIVESSVPLELGLYHAIADNKGCYPGQEVIEKIISLGSPSRRLVLVEAGTGTPPTEGTKLFNLAEPAAEVGEVTSVSAKASGGYEALALIRKIHAREGLEVRPAGGLSDAPSNIGRAQITCVAPYREEGPAGLFPDAAKGI